MFKYIHIHVTKLAPTDLEKEKDLERLKSDWIGNETRFERIVGKYKITIKVVGEEKKDFVDKIKKILPQIGGIFDKYFNFLEAIDSQTKSIHFSISSKGKIEIPFLQWFHGLELANSLLKRYEIFFKRDRDGVAVVGGKFGEPINEENMLKGFEKTLHAFRLYHIIKLRQESVAIEVTSNYIAAYLRV